ncbi:phage tail protein [Salmonella enterica]|uniref:Phage tail protein n=5 Tax=Salmonella enterica TaxID=28901 RepID=A0A3V0BPK4_SALET|nr:phage tail protein [Salmonella enterica subsp. enterica serovar Thompson]EAA5781216.1 phage tail protein [Salmonella enterica]EAM3808600.1 phage tail protein [Salmonella enterica subsp. enterica serovar Hartford]EAW1247793.1 phage tail protein [Salmonella enterica subsp. enterica]EBD3365115.1 phage tail protein [Salmonella enterica subsp. enterica serovar Bareilly]EBE4742880.1 phage tail protein [Salmonella enterica subsp. enterica serovar Infantis]EBG5202391.1 phage tail protein [Salmonel
MWLAYNNEVKLIDITNTPDNVNWPVPPGERASHDLKST